MNGTNYIAPSFKAAEDFISFWDAPYTGIRQFETGWQITGIERAPSYGQMQRLDLDKIEYGKKSSRE